MGRQIPKLVVGESMNFEEMVTDVKQGHRLRREGWPDNHYICVKKGYLMLYKGEGDYFTWIIGEADLYAQDWELVPNA